MFPSFLSFCTLFHQQTLYNLNCFLPPPWVLPPYPSHCPWTITMTLLSVFFGSWSFSVDSKTEFLAVLSNASQRMLLHYSKPPIGLPPGVGWNTRPSFCPSRPTRPRPGHLSNLSSQFSSLYFLFSSHRSSLLFPDMPSILPCHGIYISCPHFYLHFLNYVEALHPHFPRSLFKCPSVPCHHSPAP